MTLYLISNNISFEDFKSFEYTENRGGKSWENLRNASDELCREHGISVIENPQNNKGKCYYEWQQDSQGKSWKSKLRFAIDETIMESKSFDDDDIVLIHDGARPFLSKDNLEEIKQAMVKEEAACLLVPCKDTIKITENGYIVETLPREKLMAAQTPQAFRTETLLRYMRQAEAEGFQATDDCSIWERYSKSGIRVITGSYANKKITTKEDLQ